MREGAGRLEWLESAVSKASKNIPVSERNRPWGPKEIAHACHVDLRTVQTWLARKNPQEPSETNLLKLEILFWGNAPSPQQRESLRAAARRQQELRKQREAGEIWDIEARGSPYRGIASPMTEKDAAIFFGRNVQVNHLAGKVLKDRCVFVVGVSGAGKSSLVWAGLIPTLSLAGTPSGGEWQWVRFTPGNGASPVQALFLALAGHRSSPEPSAKTVFILDNIPALIEDIMQSHRDGSQLLLFIDQFEELFTLVSDSASRSAFISCLARLLDTNKVRIVATLRAEFVGHCIKSEEFGELLAGWLTAGTFWLAAPGADALGEMILGPAQRAGLSFELGLVEKIVADTGAKPGNLPLMAFALERLFNSRDTSGQMTLRSYNSFGGVEGAIAERASSIFREFVDSLGTAAEDILPDVFRDLVEVDEDTGAAVRCRIPLSSLPVGNLARQLIDKFVDAGLLVRGTDQGDPTSRNHNEGEHTLEVAHEALFRSWSQLAGWITARRSHFLLRQRLSREAREWESRGRPKSYLWSDERALEAAVMARELRYAPTALEKEFLGPVEPEEMLQQIELNSTTHEERARIGIRLALRGDPRPGIGVTTAGLPDIQWLRVAPSSRGAKGGRDREFWIARFPVTYAQYQAFIRDSDGYSNHEWWKGLKRTYMEPGGQFPNYGNHPAVNVLWCEAVAFCRWLSEKAGKTIRLPTAFEWRLAATGRQGWLYPWGNDWLNHAANTDESKLNRPVAVGLYPRGVSAAGALDMGGNVWEWCLSEIGKPNRKIFKSNGSRATLGGSWNSARRDIVVGHDGGYYLEYRNLNTGFRIIYTYI
jgi:hypothetical protein